MTLPPPVRGIRAAFVFLTRLPFGGFPYSDDDFVWAPAHAPLVGLVVGGLGAAVFALTLGAGAPAAVLLGLAATMLATGAFHEDGLADTADAMGGAIFDRARLLEILKDSRIGTYGTVALVVSIGIRASLLVQIAQQAALAESVLVSGCLAFVISHVVARVAPTWLMATMPYVTDEAHARSRPIVKAGFSQAVLATAWAALALGAAAWVVPVAPWALAMAAISVVPATGICAWRFQRRVGGITGDFLGATEQVGECVVLLALALAL